jgi:microcompartment protein CcmK/EutM
LPAAARVAVTLVLLASLTLPSQAGAPDFGRAPSFGRAPDFGRAPNLVRVPPLTRVPLRFLQPVDSDTARPGQTIRFAVHEDIIMGRWVVLRRGAKARGVVQTVTPAGPFGKSATVRLDFVKAWAVDGQGIHLTDIVITPNTLRQDRDTSGAAGAGAAGIILLGPAGIAAAALVRGGHVRVPAGAVAIVDTRTTTRVRVR